jgi:hypothetical protein
MFNMDEIVALAKISKEEQISLLTKTVKLLGRAPRFFQEETEGIIGAGSRPAAPEDFDAEGNIILSRLFETVTIPKFH